MDTKQAFVTFDVGNKGHLTRSEFKSALLSIFGFEFVKADIHSLWDSKQGEGISAAELQQIVERRSFMIGSFDKAYKMFQSLDKHHRGFLLIDDLQDAFLEACPKLAIGPEVFAAMDGDGDGRVSFSDFKRYLAQQPQTQQHVFR
eukprot:GDKI01041896.1.p1 GENE.GDKI01041896.1~~GDKI01041896.1.p1  ORF type:complete len:145 (-),score=10.83 GDKI01041896.1:37-471(-)